METLLDDSVNKDIDLLIERGGTSLTVKLNVSFLCGKFSFFAI